MTNSANGRTVEGNGARAAGAETVWVWDTDSPVGRLGLALTEAGLRRLTFLPPGIAGSGEVEELAAAMAATVSPEVAVAAAPLDGVRRQLDDYFAGRLRDFDIGVDWRGSTGFYRRALEMTAAIPYGRTSSYAGIAAAAGSPGAARAVGTAMATNPVALVVPCHRVVRADGSRGPYGGGTEAKNLLLDLEASVSGD